MRTGIRSEGGAGIFCAMLRIRRMPQMSARQLKYEGLIFGAAPVHFNFNGTVVLFLMPV